MRLTEVHHKSLAGIEKLPADLWWGWLKFITNHWLGLKSCQLICDEPDWSSSVTTGWDWKVASWFVMNLTEVHHKSLAGINKLPADLWWTCLKFITNHWLGLKSCQLICDEPQSSSSQIIRSLLGEVLSWKSCQLIEKLPQICMHACASMLVSPCSMCMRLQPGRGVHPSPFLVSSFNSPWQPVTPLVHPTVSWRDEIFRPTETHPTHTGWDFPRFHCLHGKFTWRDWPWRQPFTKKKAGTGMPGETPSLSPCATRVLFSTCAFQHYHTAFRLERVFQLGLWCFSASCFSTQWDLKILKCSRMDSAWKVPDRTDTKKAPFNYIRFNSCRIGSYMDSCHVN